MGSVEETRTGEEEKQQMNKAQPPLDLNDFAIIKEGEAEILMHAKNEVFYNKTQVNLLLINSSHTYEYQSLKFCCGLKY